MRQPWDRELAADLCARWGDVADLVLRLASALQVADPGALKTLLAEQGLAVIPPPFPLFGDDAAGESAARGVGEALAVAREQAERPRRRKGKR